ncbi:MAG TPA: Spy/CpxP family protein refolding chaperone [Bryobacteraceae bacterium]|jgi:Spy/CpxP family protein refolding chaperone|nr:Spy/CpxP family protein refolding chaperone [Bryobacteraceae bacterium]
MKKALIVFVTASLLVAGAVVGQAVVGGRHAGKAGFGMFGGARFEMLATYLDLTDAQRASAEKLLADGRAQAQPIIEQLRKNHEEMHAAVKSGASDQQLTALANQRGDLVGQLIAIRSKGMAAFYKELTPEQKAKADKMHDNIMNRIRSRWQHGAGANNQDGI